MYELLNLLDSVLGAHKKHPKGEYYYLCPFCHHPKPKFAINLERKGGWHCWHCNERGWLVGLLRRLGCSPADVALAIKLLGTDDYTPTTPDTVVPPITLPPEYIPLYNKPESLGFAYNNAMRYILQRDITASDILRYQIGYCADGKYKDRIIVPSYDDTGKLNYFVARSFTGDTFKYKNPPVSKNIVAFDFHINWNYSITLCEGVYDAIAIKRNAIPLLGKTIPNKLAEKIQRHNVRDIYLVLDTDALHAAADIAAKLTQDGRTVRLVHLDGKDPSEIGFARVSELIKQATPMSFADLIKLRVTA